MIKRISLLMVAALLVATLAMGTVAAPAFAAKNPPKQTGSCGSKGGGGQFPFGQNFTTGGQAFTFHFCPQG